MTKKLTEKQRWDELKSERKALIAKMRRAPIKIGEGLEIPGRTGAFVSKKNVIQLMSGAVEAETPTNPPRQVLRANQRRAVKALLHDQKNAAAKSKRMGGAASILSVEVA